MNNKHIFNAAFGLGAAAVLWVAYGFLGTQNLALLMTVVIASVYAYGALELHRYRQASATLVAALGSLDATPALLDDWLGRLHGTLQNSVRMRIEGERLALPGPTLTPYLLGLLVMLGMLGTFLGMVVTLNGAVFALEGTADLQAIRSAFAEPIKGLGLAFGTSVAGVASSAMLGLMSAISRRERLVAAQWLDAKISKELRPYSLAWQRQETYKAIQMQSQALPAVAEQLQAMVVRMEHMQQQLHTQLLSKQDGFHREVKHAYTDLAKSVDSSLRDSLTQSAQVAAERIAPIVTQAMADMAEGAQHMHTRLLDSTQQQLDAIATHFGSTADRVSDTWTRALAQHAQTNAAMVDALGQALQAFNTQFAQRTTALLQAVQQTHSDLQNAQSAQDTQRLDAWLQSLRSVADNLGREWQQAGAHMRAQQEHICTTLGQTAQQVSEQTQRSASQSLADATRLLAASEELVRARVAGEAAWTQEHAIRMDQISSTLRTELGALREAEATRGSAAVERLAELQTALTTHLATLGTALEAPITRLIHTASEAPRAAAEVIGKLREEVSNSAARDNALLEERSRILETLNGLLASIHHASSEQRGVIDSLVGTSAAALQQASQQFKEQVDAEAEKLSEIAAHVTGSAVEVSALGETFAFAVKSFGEANDKLIGNLQRMEGAMDKSMLRSDDQLAYYVAQAREIIDLSIMSQKEIVEELRQLPGRQAALEEAA